MSTVLLISCICIHTVLLYIYLKVFFYQRTLLKFYRRTGIEIRKSPYSYPRTYISYHKLSKLRWLTLIIIFIFNWIIGIVCLLAECILPAILPEQDDSKNFKIFLKQAEQICGERIRGIRAEIGKIMVEMGDIKPYLDLGSEINALVDCGETLSGECINILEKSNPRPTEYWVVRFSTEISLFDSFPTKIHHLNKKQLFDIAYEREVGSYNHYIKTSSSNNLKLLNRNKIEKLVAETLLCSLDIIKLEKQIYQAQNNALLLSMLQRNCALLDRAILVWSILCYSKGLCLHAEKEFFALKLVDELIVSEILPSDAREIAIYRFEEKQQFFKDEIEVGNACTIFLPQAIITTIQNPDKPSSRDITNIEFGEAMLIWKRILDKVDDYFTGIKIPNEVD